VITPQSAVPWGLTPVTFSVVVSLIAGLRPVDRAFATLKDAVAKLCQRVLTSLLALSQASTAPCPSTSDRGAWSPNVGVRGRCPMTLLAVLGVLASDGAAATSQPTASRPAQVTSLGPIHPSDGFVSRSTANGHIAYVDQSDSGWRVIHDGWASPWVQGVLKGTLALSP
jgi:hypothetical protein